MKNKPFLVLFLVASLSNVLQIDAQDDAKGQTFRAGFTIGPVASDIPGTDTRDKDSDFSKLGFCVGALVNTRLNSKNFLQIEINYITKGAQQDPDTANNGYFKLALNYIEVPIVWKHTLHMNVRRKPMDRLESIFGVSAARLVGKSYDEGGYGLAINNSTINTTDVSIFGGIAFNFTPHISFTIRYSNSVIPAINHNEPPAYLLRYTWNNGNNQVILMAVQYVFGQARPAKTKTPVDTTPAP